MTRLILALVLAAGIWAPAQAVNFSDWLKSSGRFQRKQSGKSKQTLVAAVRGVEEPGDVDPEARDYASVEKMEKRHSAVKTAPPPASKEIEEEIKIGRDVAANVLAQFGLYEDNALADQVNRIGLTVPVLTAGCLLAVAGLVLLAGRASLEVDIERGGQADAYAIPGPTQPR